MPDLKKLAVSIIGLGQIGGSLALAFRKQRLFRKIYGYDTNRVTTKTAFREGLIDSDTSTLSEAVKLADLVILAIPVGQIIEILPQVAKSLQPGAILCDTGSTKAEILKAAKRLRVKNFIGLHPVAGTEKEGIKGWESNLFKGKTITFTTVNGVQREKVSLVKALIKRIGAKPVELFATKHDRIFSGTSHLPYLVSVALVNSVYRNQSKRHLDKFLGGAFKDASRVALSSPTVMQDIMFSNRKQIVKRLANFTNTLIRYRGDLLKNNKNNLVSDLRRAREIRKSLRFR